MNSLPKLTASVAALIASLAFAWLVLSMTGTIKNRPAVQVYYGGNLELTTGIGGFEINH
jgi:hypothetical protein